MKRKGTGIPRLAMAIGIACACWFAGREACAHGGRYQGPPGRVPPTGRTPQDPTPPPPASGGDTGGSGPVGPPPSVTPPVHPPGVSGGGPAVGPGGGLGGGRTGVTPQRRRRGAGKSAGFAGWAFWWSQNDDRFLRLRERLRDSEQGGSSGTLDWLMGDRDRSQARDTESPSRRVLRRQVVPALLERVKDEHFDVRAAAVIALGKTGEPTVLPAIRGALADPDDRVSESAALALGMLGEPSAAGVLRDLALDTPAGRAAVRRAGEIRTRTRAFAILGLGFLRDGESLDVLANLACDPRDPATQRDIPVCAAVALGLRGAGASSVAERMARAASDRRRDAIERAHLFGALGKIGEPSVLPMLRRAWRDPEVQVRRSAVLALGRLADPEDAASIEVLIAAATRGVDLQARHWALVALGKVGGARATKVLRTALADGGADEAAFAALGLAILAKDAGERRRIEAPLRRAFDRTRSAELRGAIAIASGIAETRETAPAIAAIARGKSDPTLRGHAAIALGMMNARDSLPSVRSALEGASREPDLQRSAAIALGLMGDRSASKILIDVIRSAGTEFVKSSAATALGHIGDTAAVNVLIEISADRGGVPDLARAHATVALGILAEKSELPVLSVLGEDLNYRALVDSLQEALTIS